ncbi:DUF4861 domain-containing protein [Coprobacter sp.]
MKKVFLLLFVTLIGYSCSGEKNVKISVKNDSKIDRENEIVEMSLGDISQKIGLSDTTQIVVLDEQGQQVPYQLTYNGNLIFPVMVKANSSVEYTVQAGTPEKFDTLVYGRQYPERVDDIAWENDRIAFRTYGPALQATGERAFGYDVWVKSVSEPVVEKRYEGELNPETKAQIAELKKKDPKAANELYKSVSYHVDHGNGLDCYKVGPTLGGGTAALMANDTIIYPYCYKTFEILDNGPLRFTVKLTYNPLTVNGDSSIIETRLISLDAGTQLNKTTVTYDNLKEEIPIVAGIVLHEPESKAKYATVAEKGYISYADPTDNPDNGNGTIFVGAIVPSAKDTKAVYFEEKEKKDLRGDADGHVLAIADYVPNSEFVYYWGAGWSKYGFDTIEEWNTYMDKMASIKKEPLKVSIK